MRPRGLRNRPQVAVAPVPPIAAAPAEPQIAPVSALVEEVAIPHTSFELANGLKVLVHEDHKAPVVAVSVWYNVGSKDEPKGKTGFAHLFEHLMFYGSENVREGIMPLLEKLGASDWNGTTWYDRTNYYQTVPKAALERMLFIESDRMGHLLGAIDQPRLDNQRGVVQNEKRQRDNQPGGLVDYAVMEALFPPGHPYRHSTIGSMADLDAASLADVKSWFVERYGPNNAVISLAGDITEAEARTLMNRYFGAIPRGPVNTPAAADVPTLPAPQQLVMKDRVAAVQVQRNWAVPGLASDDLAALDIGASILGGLASSRLDKMLVRDEQLAVSVSAVMQPFHRIGLFEVTATVKPGVEPAALEKRLDEILAQFIAEGPTEDELSRAATSQVAARIRGLEKVGDDGGKAATLAEGELYVGDSAFYQKQLRDYASVTAPQVRSALQRWLGRPVLSVRLEQGDRPPYVEAKPVKTASTADLKVVSVKRDPPPIGASPPLDFPDVTHVTLSNGMQLDYAQRTAAPLTQLALSFDAGFSAEAQNERGLQNMVLSLLDEGAGNRTAQQIAEEQERLGAAISIAGGADRSTVTLSSLSANLAPSLALMTDIVARPTFAPGEVERIRAQLITNVAQAKTNPNQIASRALPTLLYGASHPYGTTALGDSEAIRGFTRDQLIGFQQRWLRPDNARLFVVSNLPLATVQPLIEQALATWRAPAVPRGAKQFSALPARPTGHRIVLIDRPGSPQSVIFGGEVTTLDARDDLTAFLAASNSFGGSTGSRLFLDLREAKGWSYGAYGYPAMNLAAVPYLIQAPVQADRTGDSLRALIGHLTRMSGAEGVTTDELDRTVASAIGELPGQFETSMAVLGGMQTNALYGRPDNYYELLADKYRAQTRTSLDQSFRTAIDPKGFVWVVVGDAAKVRPQLRKLKLPIEEIQPR